MNWKLIRILDTYLGIPLLSVLRCVRRPSRAVSPEPVPRECRRILLVKFWGIGNIFMMLPSAAGLRAAYPSAAIDLLTLQGNRDAAEVTQSFASIYTIDTRNIVRFAVTTLRAVKELRRNAYACIVDFEQFAKFSAILCALIGKRTTIGFDTAGKHRHYLYSSSVVYDNSIHVTRSYAALARAAGGRPAGVPPAPQLPLDAGVSRVLAGKLGIRPDRTVIVMHIGTSRNFEERRWPIASYAALADLLVQHHDVQIVMTGLKEEGSLAAGLKGQVRSRDRVIDAIGMLNFREFFSLVQISDLVISADTAPVHLASAAGIPVAALYGPNTPLLYGPWGENGLAFYEKLECSPCITNFNAKTHVCRHPEGKGACMRKIGAEEVYERLRERYFDGSSVHRLKKLAQRDLCIR